MIRNFNFYDVYGYLMPGLALITVFWIPFGIKTGSWPAHEWSSTLFVIILAYIAGHVLQTFSHRALPDTIKGRFPSAVLLDESDKRFPDRFKTDLCNKIVRIFSVNNPCSGDDGDRGVAFLLCRSALMQNKSGAYAEQAQGMYVLTRGLGAAFIVGAAYHSGWAASVIKCDALMTVAFVGAGIALTLSLVFSACEDPKGTARQIWASVCLLIAILLLGVLSGHKIASYAGEVRDVTEAKNPAACCLKIAPACCVQIASSGEAAQLTNAAGLSTTAVWKWALGLVAFEILLAIRLLHAFRHFADVFAQSVYRDFFALGTVGKQGGEHSAGENAGGEEDGE